MHLMKRFDFGNDCVTPDPGYFKIERIYKTSRFMWVNELRNQWFSEFNPSPYKDMLYGPRGEFRIGLPRGHYRLVLHFFDPTQPHAPFDCVIAQTQPHAPILTGREYLRRRVTVPQNERCSTAFDVDFDGGVLSVGFDGTFVVSGMDVFGTAADFIPMYPEAPADVLPSPAELSCAPRRSVSEMLQSVCDYFLACRTPDGFIGDYENFGGAKRLWYTTSYPMRTLLCASRLLNRPDYLDIVVQTMDLFVSEQLPEGAFTQAFRAQPTAQMSEAEMDYVRHHNWMNLADIGSMVAALAAACHYVTGARRKHYLNAVQKYTDGWMLRYRMPVGGFTNGWVSHIAEKIYSVSTASSALTLALLYRETGAERYLRFAEDAVLFIAKDWNNDGRGIHYVYDHTFPGHDYYQGTNEFGDGFYTMEAFSALLAVSRRAEVRRVLFDVLDKYLFGRRGILALMGARTWWPLQNSWHNSKSAANPILLLDYLRVGPEFGASPEKLDAVRAHLAQCEHFLCTPEYAQRIGVLLKTPAASYPFLNHSIQCWAGCAVAATGFGGIALADMLAPGIIYNTDCGKTTGEAGRAQ